MSLRCNLQVAPLYQRDKSAGGAAYLTGRRGAAADSPCGRQRAAPPPEAATGRTHFPTEQLIAKCAPNNGLK